MTINPETPKDWPSPNRWFYTREELIRRGIKLSDSSLSRKEAKGEFPKRVKLGRFTCAWVASEIDAYVEAVVAARSVSG